MDHRKLIAFVICCWSFCSIAQSQEVIASAGSSFENSSGSISFTLGESMIHTYSSSGAILTQGFHQPTLAVIDFHEDLLPGIGVKAYPNPTKEYVILSIENPQEHSFVLCDMTGRIIEKNLVTGTETEIDFSSLKPAPFILKVFDHQKEVKTFKIIKH